MTLTSELDALYGSMQHTDKVGILPGEQITLTLVQSVTIAANYTASGNTPFCDSESHRGALEASLKGKGYAARGIEPLVLIRNVIFADESFIYNVCVLY